MFINSEIIDYSQEKFLASFILFKKPLKETTAALIEKVYFLELQAQVNYTGAGGKQPLKCLCSTQLLISKYIYIFLSRYILILYCSMLHYGFVFYSI